MSIKSRATLVPFSVWSEWGDSREYIDWNTCSSAVNEMGLGKASIRLLIEFVATLGFYPEDENNPGAPLPGFYTIFPKVLVDEVLRDHNPIFVKESGEVFDVGKIKDRFKKLRRRNERENKKILKINGYDGSTHSEVFAGFNLVKKQVSKIKKRVETFMETYGFLLPEANLCLTKTWVHAGYNYHPSFGPTRNVGPGERRLPKVQFSISQQLPTSNGGIVCITFADENVHITSSQHRKKKLNLNRPESVVARLQESGLAMNAHDYARAVAAAIKHAPKKKRIGKRAQIDRSARPSKLKPVPQDKSNQ